MSRVKKLYKLCILLNNNLKYRFIFCFIMILFFFEMCFSFVFKKNDINNYILMDLFLVLFLVIFKAMSNAINLVIDKLYPSIKYAEGFSLSTWYDSTYDYNESKSWLENVEANLLDIGINLNQIKVFVSPTANKGIYEYNLSQKYPNTTFLVTDGEVPSKIPETTLNFLYLKNNNDAYDIKNYLLKQGIQNTDVIWDIKGAIWHNHKKDNLEKILVKYHEVLSENGVIVFDAYELGLLKAIVNLYKTKLEGECIGYGERSTYDRIQKNLRKSGLVNELYDLELTGLEIYRVGVLRKRK